MSVVPQDSSNEPFEVFETSGITLLGGRVCNIKAQHKDKHVKTTALHSGMSRCPLAAAFKGSKGLYRDVKNTKNKTLLSLLNLL